MSKRSDPGAILAALAIPAAPGSIYERALTHRSFAFEQLEPLPHNERLEFLGDAVLDLIVTDLIFRGRPQLAEGEMARLRAAVVNTQALAGLARRIGLGEHIMVGKGELASGGRDKASLLADTLEAVIGATYIDRGIDYTADALGAVFTELIEDAAASGRSYDPKTALQEVAVRDRGGRPSYRVASSGPDHAKSFIAHVYVTDELLGVGSGRSKKEAEQNAAREALERLDAESPTAATRLGRMGGRDARAS